MAQYIVKGSQNIFDIAIQLYGSIEGIYDLLISNSWLDMDTELKVGMSLSYHDYFAINDNIVKGIKDRKLKCANSERNVYWKDISYPQIFQFSVDSNAEDIGFKASGNGIMAIDWGDNRAIDIVQLEREIDEIHHNFDNIASDRTVKIYGNFSLTSFDTSEVTSQLYALRTITVDEFISNGNKWPLDCLFLFNGTYAVNLQDSRIKDLSPIVGLSLQKLDLRNVVFEKAETLDDYLTQVVDNYGSRRNCEVLLTTEPGEKGMEAIRTIVAEPEWNASGAWVFNINGNIITAS